MTAVTLDRPWLTFDLGADMQVLSWTIDRPGLVRARRILWREVRDADLTPDLDVGTWLDAQLRARGATDAVTFLTSRDIRCYTERVVQVADATAHAVATVGFSNAERVGHRRHRSGTDLGTINVALRVNRPLTQAALLETMSIVVQARTAAVMDAGLSLSTGIATGTGTDCVAVAGPQGDTSFAGLHTELGEATGRAVYDAVALGARDWMRDNDAGARILPRDEGLCPAKGTTKGEAP